MEWNDTNLGIIFNIPCMQRDGLEVKSAVEVDGGNDILERRDDTLDSGDVLLFES